MTKLEIIKWIESLENQAQQSNKFFIERNELYIEKQSLIKYIEDKIKKVRESTCDSKELGDITLFNYMRDLMLLIYKNLLERIENNNYEDTEN